MKIDIEEYRGWNITFDTESDTFSAYSNTYDQEKIKPGIKNLRDYIDDFIKNNQDFKPIVVERRETGKKITLIGVRKDNAFTILEESGSKKQLSGWDEKYYHEINPENEPIKQEIAKLKLEAKVIEGKIDELTKSMKGRSVSEIRKDLGIK